MADNTVVEMAQSEAEAQPLPDALLKDEPSVPAPSGQSWKFVAALFFFVSFIEAFVLGQLFAFLPLYLQEQMGLGKDESATLTGLITPLVFLVGLPLVPLWGAWAERYGRKAIIARSAYVEAVVLLLIGLSQNPLELALSIGLAGFQLGNTGLMLAAQRSVTPRNRVGLALSLIGIASPIGFAVGPQLGGFLTDNHIVDLRGLYFIGSVLSLISALLVTLVYRETQRRVKGEGSVVRAAWGALREVVTVRITALIFLCACVLILAWQMARPFIPLLVQSVYHDPATLKSAIGLVTGTATLVGALLTLVTGVIGDRFGYRRVLGVAAVGTALALAALPFSPNIAVMALISGVLSITTTTSMTMVYSLIATEVPEERRSSTLNLAFVPLYAGGIIGPIIGAYLNSFGFIVLMLVAAGVAGLSLLVWQRLNQFAKQIPA